MTETIPTEIIEPSPAAVAETPSACSHASRPAVIIPVRHVAFGTAAAVPLVGPTHRLLSVVRALFVRSAGSPRPEPRHYPPRREVFLEHAAMRREMLRL